MATVDGIAKCYLCKQWYPREEVVWLSKYGFFVCDPCIVIRSKPPSSKAQEDKGVTSQEAQP